MKTRTVNGVLFWRNLKLYFGTADRPFLYSFFYFVILNKLKTRTVDGAIWLYLKRYFGTADGQIVENCSILNGACLRYLKEYLELQ